MRVRLFYNPPTGSLHAFLRYDLRVQGWLEFCGYGLFTPPSTGSLYAFLSSKLRFARDPRVRHFYCGYGHFITPDGQFACIFTI